MIVMFWIFCRTLASQRSDERLMSEAGQVSRHYGGVDFEFVTLPHDDLLRTHWPIRPSAPKRATFLKTIILGCASVVAFVCGSGK